MATNLQTIAQYFNNQGFNYTIEGQRNQIVIRAKTDNLNSLPIAIRLEENGEYLKFIVPEIFAVKESIFKGVLFQTLLNNQYDLKMIRWAYDHTDGEVRAYVDLPLEDAPLTEKQFYRCLFGLIRILDEVMPRLKQVLATGNDPMLKNPGERILQGMSPEMIAMLEAALEARKQKG